jgi:hypothetical protein
VFTWGGEQVRLGHAADAQHTWNRSARAVCPIHPMRPRVSAQRPAVQQRTPRSRSSVTRSQGAAGAARGVAARGELRACTCGVRLLQGRGLGGSLAQTCSCAVSPVVAGFAR